MGFFSRKRDVIDLTERYRKQQEQLAEMKGETVDVSSSSDTSSEANSSGNAGGFGFGIFGMGANASNSNTSNSSSSDSDYVDVSSPAGSSEKRRRLAKRLMDMTEKIEDLNNQIYHLQQRLEVLERKSSSRY